MLYSTLIIELKYIYVYIAIAIATTISFILIQVYHATHSKKRKFFSYISYTITIFVFLIGIFLIFVNKDSGYISFFTLFVGGK